MTNRFAARAFPCNYMHLNFPSKPTTVKLKIVLLFYYRGPSPAASRPAKGNQLPNVGGVVYYLNNMFK